MDSITKFARMTTRPTYKPDLESRGVCTLGMTELQAMQWELFYRNTSPGVENRLVQFTPTGVRLYEFDCPNFGYREGAWWDYIVRYVTDIHLEG